MAGSYVVKIWNEGWLSHSQTVDLPAGGTLRIDIAARK